MKLSKGKVNLLIDGQFGSTGKGLLASYIGERNTNINICVSNAGPNSGHTFYYNNEKCIVKQLPVTAITNPGTKIYLCAGAVININILFEELDKYNISPDRLYIHPNATIIQKEDILFEQGKSATRISSTQNGVGAAIARKTNRESIVAKDFFILNRYVRKLDLQSLMDKNNATVFMEVPQGFSLSLNSKFYPYCTSRNISISSALNDLEVHPYYLGKTIASIRTYPIRVGNLPNSYSGDFYTDSKETTWEKIGVSTEYTTNTKRERRVATFSYLQYKEMIKAIRPDYVFLNFCNYLRKDKLDKMLCKLPEVTHIGFGPKIKNIGILRPTNE